MIIMIVIMIMINLSSVECVSVWHWAQPLEKPAVCLWWGCPQVRKMEKKQKTEEGILICTNIQCQQHGCQNGQQLARHESSHARVTSIKFHKEQKLTGGRTDKTMQCNDRAWG